GEATMEVQKSSDVNGRPALQLISQARSNKFIDAFFIVRDYNASVVDKESLVSFSFHQNLKEGHYHVVRNTFLDYKNRVYTFERDYKGNVTRRTGPIDETVSDILSAFFVTRTL